MSAPVVKLSPADLTAIAEAVVDLLEERGAPERRRLVDAATLARELNVSREWVYSNADALGAVRLGEGERPRLRFDLERARQHSVLTTAGPKVATPVATSRRRRASKPTTALLPINGESQSNNNQRSATL